MKNDSIVGIAPPQEKVRSRSGIQVIARAAAILRALRDAPDGLSLGEIAKTLDLARSTVQRIVDALDQENLVIAASPSRGVRLGPAILSLASATRFEFAEMARNHLQAIAAECGETVAVSILNGTKVVFIDHVHGTHTLRVEPGIGQSLPVESTANGKAIMAIMDQGRLEKKFRRRLNFEQNTPNTITNWEDLMTELEEVREQGVAFDIEENALGISAVSVAIVLPDKEYAAISIPAPAQRFAEHKAELAELLKVHCRKLQDSLTIRR